MKLRGKSSLLKGTIQLAAAGLFTRVLGLANRMVLSRLIGAEGLGLFQMILPVYALLAVTASLGLPGAVTKMVADRHARGDLRGQLQVRGISLQLVCVAALLCTALLLAVLSLPLDFIPDRRIIGALRLMPAAFFFAALSSILRSYFQGRSNMAPTAFSQVAEQIVRVSVGLCAVFYLLPLGLEQALLGIMAGVIAGEMACLAVLFLFQGDRKLPPAPRGLPRNLLREMFLLSFPILAIRLGTSLTQTVESLLIPGRLQAAGFSAAQATALFGQLTGMAVPLLFLPTVLIIPLNVSLVPAVAGAVTLHLRERLDNLVRLSLWGTIVMGTLAALTFYYFASELTAALYGESSAAALVARLAPAAPFAYLQFTTAAILHGMGHPGIAVANDMAGTAASLLIIYRFAAMPGWGINGVICGYTVAFTAITILDCYFIFRLAGKV